MILGISYRNTPSKYDNYIDCFFSFFIIITIFLINFQPSLKFEDTYFFEPGFLHYLKKEYLKGKSC